MNTAVTIPPVDQLHAVLHAHVRAVGAVNVRVTNVMHSIDCAFPDMDDEAFAEVRTIISPLVEEIRQAAINAMWN